MLKTHSCELIQSKNSPQQSATDTGHWKDAVNPTRCKCEIFRPTLETLMLKEILRKGGLPRCPPSSSKQQLLETTFPTQLPQVLPIVGAGYTELHRATQRATQSYTELHRATECYTEPPTHSPEKFEMIHLSPHHPQELTNQFNKARTLSI